MSSDFPDYVLEPGDGSDPWEAESFPASEQTVQLGGPRAGLLHLTRLMTDRPTIPTAEER
jgi:hypothetical protein